MSVADVWDRAEIRQDKFGAGLRARIAELEEENERSRLVLVLLRLAAENVLRGGRRFPPRAEWRELHEAVSGATWYLNDTWDDNLPLLDDITGDVPPDVRPMSSRRRA